MQKSPPDYARWKLLAEQFVNTHFIIMTRNPFAHIEGLRRKSNLDLDIKEFVQGWINILVRQLDCKDTYEQSTMFSFEDLCLEKPCVVDKIKNLMPPELQDVKIEDVSYKHPQRDDGSPSYHGIAFNIRSINRLSRYDIYVIKKMLEPYQAQLEEVGYSI